MVRDTADAERVGELRRYDVLDNDDDAERYDRITDLAARLLDVPIALISLVDADRQWFKSRVGLEVRETPRDVAFCDHAIGSDETMVVPDAHDDARFRDNPLVTGEPRIRFYAGAPLVSPRGPRIGTLCVIDRQPRTLNALQRSTLRALADVVVDALELRLRTRQLAVQQRELARLLEILPVGVVIHRGGPAMYVNPEALRICGIADRDAMAERAIDSFIHPDEMPQVLARRAGLFAGGTIPAHDLRLVGATGVEVVTRMESAVVTYQDAPAISSVFLDVTAERRASTEVSVERDRLEAILDTVEDGVALLDANRRLVFANRGYRAMFGLSEHGLVGLDRDAFVAHIATCLRDPEADLERFRVVSLEPTGANRFELVRPRRQILRRVIKPIRTAIDDGWLVVWHDETDAVDLIAERERSALTDPLTGVANRRGGEAAARRELARWHRSGGSLSMAVADIDHFKRVNDVHGHAVGDVILRAVADVLSEEARTTDTVVRWGGEEFVVLLPGPIDGAVAFAERARAAIAALTTPAGSIALSFGVTEFAVDDDLDRAFRRADARLYRAKQAGRNRVCAEDAEPVD